MPGLFQRTPKAGATSGRSRDQSTSDYPTVVPSNESATFQEKGQVLPVHRVNHNGHKVTKGIEPEGESGRRGIHPLHFIKICWSSTSHASRVVNLLWPVVPAAIAVRYGGCASSLAKANVFNSGLGLSVPVAFDTALRNTGNVTAEDLDHKVLMGMCFFVGGMKRDEQSFHEAISEVGSGLLLTAGLGLSVPVAFDTALRNTGNVTAEDLDHKVLMISRIGSIFLIVAYAIYVWFQMHTHHGIYDSLYEVDEQNDEDRHEDLRKAKLTFTECILALSISIALVTLIAIGLVEQITPVVEERHISDAFVGLILVPIVEKAAEHLTAMDEAWDNQMNFALSHVLGATIQTTLFNAPLVVIVGWGLNKPMDMKFELFDIVMLILAILVVGNFLRDQKSNYLEGALCVIVYMIIAVAAYYYPNPVVAENGAPAEKRYFDGGVWT
ncbi:related to vacuolar Ca2+/H+ antiporter [Phialocephala subalpina]|uniref:Related to vacuolar Ca2+/H+ antiporter n=1 Tax=Phialocephala subalpina TaxID=576137 RepID=A0A1L7WSZ9_9HELO|nr:related to vacuolar Ca2+/H+ antiporter [Phialocephala subalpina]